MKAAVVDEPGERVGGGEAAQPRVLVLDQEQEDGGRDATPAMPRGISAVPSDLAAGD